LLEALKFHAISPRPPDDRCSQRDGEEIDAKFNEPTCATGPNAMFEIKCHIDGKEISASASRQEQPKKSK
jgi:hypothetical protein